MADAPLKSSFLTRTISKQDAIIQIFRPMLAGRVGNALDVFDRIVTEAETLTKLGTRLQPGNNGGENFIITPDDLKANLDEFPELVEIAEKGREFLTGIGYVSRRKATPITGEGAAPVGKTVNVQPLTITLPGSEPITGAVVSPKVN